MQTATVKQAIDKPTDFSLVDSEANIGNSFLALLAYTSRGQSRMVESRAPRAFYKACTLIEGRALLV